MCQKEEGDSQTWQTVLPCKIGLGPAERVEESPASSTLSDWTDWVHVFSLKGRFDTAQLPLPCIDTFRRTSDWLHFVILVYKLFF